MKEQILFELNNRLTAMGIMTQTGQGTDISIETDFLDASWGTGKNKIHYEAFIYANEQEKIVYMYEKTTEEGQGFSFGGDNGSSFQNGAILFRKVKSIQYGPDGKAYEYDIDLGAIPKTVKEVAKANGWKFKTVIGKHKVMNQPISEGHHYESMGKEDVPQVANENKALFGMVSFVILGMLMVGMLVLFETTIVTWIVSFAIYGIAFFLQRILKNKNIVFHLVLCLLTALALFFQIALFTGGDMRVTSASLKDPHMTSAMSSKGVPVDRVKSYLPNGTEFIATAQLYDAPHYTKIRFVWTYVTEKIKLTEFNMDSQESDEAEYIYSNITNDKIWPIGDYQVEIFLGERTKPDAVIKFKVSENP